MFNYILSTHPTITATILRNDQEMQEIVVKTIPGVLLEGTGQPELDIQMGEGGYRFFTAYENVEDMDLKPTALQGYFLEIENNKFEITQSKNSKTKYSNQTKLILTKYEN